MLDQISIKRIRISVKLKSDNMNMILNSKLCIGKYVAAKNLIS